MEAYIEYERLVESRDELAESRGELAESRGELAESRLVRDGILDALATARRANDLSGI